MYVRPQCHATTMPWSHIDSRMQVILNKKGDTYDGKISDVWSCGVMLFVTLVGQYPFERPEDKGDPQKMHKMIRRIVNVDYKLPSRVEVSDECKVWTELSLVSANKSRQTRWQHSVQQPGTLSVVTRVQRTKHQHTSLPVSTAAMSLGHSSLSAHAEVG